MNWGIYNEEKIYNDIKEHYEEDLRKKRITWGLVAQTIEEVYKIKEDFVPESLRKWYDRQRRKRGVLEGKTDTDYSRKRRELERQERLQENIDRLLDRRKVLDHNFGKHARFGVVSDKHYGNIYSNPQITEVLYKRMKKEGCECVYDAGDISDGHNMYDGHIFDLYAVGAKKQSQEIINRHPNDLDTFYILGNHDMKFHKQNGTLISDLIDPQRSDLHCIGYELKNIEISNDIIMQLVHPSGGTAYAISYKCQKYIESLSGGEKPNIIIMGHFHKAEMMPVYRNVCGIQAGTTESQTSFMAKKPTPAHLGGWIIDVKIDRKNLISSFNAEFIGFYEEDIRRVGFQKERLI